MPLKIVTIERLKPVAVISARGEGFVPQSQVMPVISFCFLEIKLTIKTVTVIMISKPRSIPGIETEAKTFCVVMDKFCIVAATPDPLRVLRLSETLDREVATVPASTPNTNVRIESIAMLTLREIEDSEAWLASSLLDLARKVTPKTFTKHAAASPPVKAREPAAITKDHSAIILED